MGVHRVYYTRYPREWPRGPVESDHLQLHRSQIIVLSKRFRVTAIWNLGSFGRLASHHGSCGAFNLVKSFWNSGPFRCEFAHKMSPPTAARRPLEALAGYPTNTHRATGQVG